MPTVSVNPKPLGASEKLKWRIAAHRDGFILFFSAELKKYFIQSSATCFSLQEIDYTIFTNRKHLYGRFTKRPNCILAVFL